MNQRRRHFYMNLKSRRGSKDSFRFQAIDGLWSVCLVWGHPGTRLASQALIRKIRAADKTYKYRHRAMIAGLCSHLIKLLVLSSHFKPG